MYRNVGNLQYNKIQNDKIDGMWGLLLTKCEKHLNETEIYSKFLEGNNIIYYVGNIRPINFKPYGATQV